jgi:hypothetical protein
MIFLVILDNISRVAARFLAAIKNFVLYFPDCNDDWISRLRIQCEVFQFYNAHLVGIE